MVYGIQFKYVFFTYIYISTCTALLLCYMFVCASSMMIIDDVRCYTFNEWSMNDQWMIYEWSMNYPMNDQWMIYEWSMNYPMNWCYRAAAAAAIAAITTTTTTTTTATTTSTTIHNDHRQRSTMIINYEQQWSSTAMIIYINNDILL